MKSLYLFFALSMVLLFSARNAWDTAQPIPDEPQTTVGESFPERYILLPGKDQIIFCSSPGVSDIQYFRHLGYLTLIRLNGEGNDQGRLSIDQEARAADRSGMRMYYYNIDGGDDIAVIVKQLEGGKAIIHCKHGAHRAPLVAGCYLIKQGYRYSDVIRIIGWQKIQHDTRYQRYVNILKRWANSYSNSPLI